MEHGSSGPTPDYLIQRITGCWTVLVQWNRLYGCESICFVCFGNWIIIAGNIFKDLILNKTSILNKTFNLFSNDIYQDSPWMNGSSRLPLNIFVSKLSEGLLSELWNTANSRPCAMQLKVYAVAKMTLRKPIMEAKEWIFVCKTHIKLEARGWCQFASFCMVIHICGI